MLGVGGFGGQRRAWMRATGLFQIIAFYDWNPEVAANFAREEGSHSLPSVDAVLTHPGVEAVVISTGAKFHEEQCVKALELGLPVFVEKPLCSTPNELMRLAQMVESTGLPFVVGHNELQTNPIAKKIREMIDSGELGKICAFEETTAHSGAFTIKPGDWRGDPEKNPGGMLFQCGVHALHELMFYFGPVTDVVAQMRYDITPTRTADAAFCLLHFQSGLVGTLNAYHCTPYRHTLSIFGTEATLYRDDRFFEEGTHVLIQRRAKNCSGACEPKETIEFSGKADPTASLRNFYDSVRANDPSICYPGIREGARAVAVTFAAEESAKTGLSVSVDKYLPKAWRNGSSSAVTA